MNYPNLFSDYPPPIYRVDNPSPFDMYRVDNPSPFDQIYKRVNHHKSRPIPLGFHPNYNEINYNNEINRLPPIYYERVPPPELPEININQEMFDPYYYNNYNKNIGYIERPLLDYPNKYYNSDYENDHVNFDQSNGNLDYDRTLSKNYNQNENYPAKEWIQTIQNNYNSQNELDVPNYQTTIQNKNKNYPTVINPNLNENLTFDQRRRKFLEKIDRKSALSNIIGDPDLSAIENDSNYLIYDGQMNTAFETTFRKNVSPVKKKEETCIKNIQEQKSEIIEICEQSSFAKFLIVCVDFDKRIEKKKWQIYENDNFKLISFYRLFLKEKKGFVDIDDFRATLMRIFQIKLSIEEAEIILSRIKKIGDGYKLKVIDFDRLFLPLSIIDSDKSSKAPLKPGEQEINIQIENNEILKKTLLKMFKLILELEVFSKKIKTSLAKEINTEELFKEIDTDLKGFITSKNLQKFLKKNNFDVPEVDLVGVMRRFTRGSGSRINFVQFEQEMSSF